MKNNARNLIISDKTQKSLQSGAVYLCEEINNINTDNLRKIAEEQYGTLTEQEFFEYKQNLIGFFSLLYDIQEEIDNKQNTQVEERGQ